MSGNLPDDITQDMIDATYEPTEADVAAMLKQQLTDAEKRGAAEALKAVLALHAPKREQYFDIRTGEPSGSAIECAYCSEQECDGVDYPCATARAAGVTP